MTTSLTTAKLAWSAAATHFPDTKYSRYRPRPWDFKKKIMDYLRPLPRRPRDDSCYETALRLTREDFRVPKINPYHINDSIRHFQHPEKSPGLPYTKRGMKRKADVPSHLIKSWVHTLKYAGGRHKVPCTAASRSMISEDEDKFRMIWVYPAHMTYAEGMFAQPLIQRYLSVRSHYGLWIRYHRGDASWLKSFRRFKGHRWLALDWSGFDYHVPAWLIRDAFDIVWEQLDVSKYQEFGKPTHDHTLPRLQKVIVDYFINTPLRLPSGEVIVKHQGVPSGSFFTSIIDSICNAIISHYILRKCGIQYSRVARWYVGDDSLTLVYNSVDLEKIAQVAKEVFGMELNVSKSEWGEEVPFLGYRLCYNRHPQADYDKLMGQLLCPSSRDVCIEDFVSRARALQLSCFGLGCRRFTFEVQAWLEKYGLEDIRPKLHHRDELYLKLQQLDLAHWPPLAFVMLTAL